MKHCSKCGAEIVNGVNGCMLSDDCFKCVPIAYSLQPAKQPNYYNSTEYDSYIDSMISQFNNCED